MRMCTAGKKTSYVSKKESGRDWIAQCQDDDDRTYHGNIFRGKDSVIQGTIDMLILAHSDIVGYSGSTFQSMARMIGEINPLVSIARPEPFEFFAKSEIKKRIDNGLISLHDFMKMCAVVSDQFGRPEAITLLEYYYEKCADSDLPFLLYTLGVYCLNDERPRMAAIQLEKLTVMQSENHSGWLHLCYAYLLMNDLGLAGKAYNGFKASRSESMSDYELNLLRFVQNRMGE